MICIWVKEHAFKTCAFQLNTNFKPKGKNCTYWARVNNIHAQVFMSLIYF